MPGPKRIPDAEIQKAIGLWQGNLRAAADALGMTRNNLRKRLEQLGIGENERKAMGPVIPVAPGVPLRPPPKKESPMSPSDPRALSPIKGAGKAQVGGTQQTPDLYPGGDVSPTFIVMQGGGAIDDAPPVTVRSRPQPIRLRPDQVEQLRQAKYDFQAKYRAETTENKVLEVFFAEEFEKWKARKLKAREGGS